MSFLASHLWQSLLCFAVICGFVTLTRDHSSRMRLWLWRVAAIKLVVPFALFSTIGEWIGFPIRYAGDPPPASLVRWAHDISPWFSAGSWFESTTATLILLAILLLAVVAAARATLWSIHTEALGARVEELRLDADPDDREPSIGFARAALITACAIMTLAMPTLAGALRAATHAHDVLETNTRSMSEARVTLRPAKPGLGSRYFVSVTPTGVVIRNITLQELTAMAYGVNRFFVRGKHFKEADESDWLVDSRHDVLVEAPVIEPEKFDTFAMQPAITRELARNFGLEIYVNSECQAPCGKWGDRVLVEVAPGSWALVDKDKVPPKSTDAQP